MRTTLSNVCITESSDAPQPCTVTGTSFSRGLTYKLYLNVHVTSCESSDYVQQYRLPSMWLDWFNSAMEYFWVCFAESNVGLISWMFSLWPIPYGLDTGKMNCMTTTRRIFQAFLLGIF